MVTEKTPPIYRPRRNQKRLDLRPAIWSLQNHPEEWDMVGRYTVRHKPSQVRMWVSNGPAFVNVYEGHGHKEPIGRLDRWRFWREYKKWKRRTGVLKRTVSANNSAFAQCFSCTNDGAYTGEVKLEDGEVIYRGNFPVNGDAIYAYMTAQRLAAE